ncbi:MAG: 30S ribosomal protein S8 [bacterium]|nr:30S ribosomal protein S8 [bacterium]
MSMSDPISDLLTRIRNGLGTKHDRVDMPSSRVKNEICAVLKREGYITDYKMVEDDKQGVLQVTLKYTADGEPVLQGLKRVSKPSLRVYTRCQDLKQVRSGLGIAIVSTSRGLMTGKQAREQNVGGEILCEVW